MGGGGLGVHLGEDIGKNSLQSQLWLRPKHRAAEQTSGRETMLIPGTLIERSEQKHLKEGSAAFGFQLEGTRHHAREVRVAAGLQVSVAECRSRDTSAQPSFFLSFRAAPNDVFPSELT